MFSDLIVGYLFLGGAGAGTCLVLCLLEASIPRRLLSFRGVHAGGARVERAMGSYRRLFAPAYAIALLAMVLGMAFLCADLGRSDRLSLLVVSATPTYISIGAYALFICAALSAVACAIWSDALKAPRLWPLRILEAAIGISAVAVMAYTGLLLASFASVPLWHTPWLPVLFVLASISCGIAIVAGSAHVNESFAFFPRAMGAMLAADSLIIVGEIVVTAALVCTVASPHEVVRIFSGFMAVSGSGTAQAAVLSTASLLRGQHSALFWGGFVGLGLVVPLALELVLRRLRSRRDIMVLAIICVCCVLAGSLAMRLCIVDAGMHPLPIMAGVLS